MILNYLATIHPTLYKWTTGVLLFSFSDYKQVAESNYSTRYSSSNSSIIIKECYNIKS
jgi:hypothetical protein